MEKRQTACKKKKKWGKSRHESSHVETLESHTHSKPHIIMALKSTSKRKQSWQHLKDELNRSTCCSRRVQETDMSFAM